MLRKLIGSAAAIALLASPVASAEEVRIGFMTTLSGGGGVIGTPMKNAFELALEHVDGKVGGLDTVVFYGDDQRKPDVGKQVVNKMIKQDRVQFMTGIIWSNILAAVYRSTVRRDVFLISSNAGWSGAAGKDCSENFFNVAFQNDQIPEGMGKHLQDKGIKSVYTISPNYQAGKDMIEGFKRYYKGNIVKSVFTKLGQNDYQAEISALRAAGPDAVFIFLPGGMGINFMKQYQQAGLTGTLPLYTAYSVDAISLPALKDAAIGIFGAQHWTPDLGNAQNQRFVAAYKEKYDSYPAFYAAQAYDTVMFLDHAIRKAGGVSDRDKLRAAMRTGDFPSVRGTFKFNNNHFPVQNIYLRQAMQNDAGEYVNQTKGVILSSHGDAYAKNCKMKW